MLGIAIENVTENETGNSLKNIRRAIMLKKRMSWLLAATMVASMGMGCVPAAAEETGINVEIETAASGQYEQTLTARIDSSEAPTIFVIDSVNMLNTWKDYISDLSDTELYSYVTDDAYTMNDGNGAIYAISYSLEAWGIIVNKKITDAYFASPNKSTEFTFEYAENYKNILDLYLNNSVIEPNLVGTKTVDDSMAEFALGKCAMIQNGVWAWNTINGTDGKAVEADDVCFIPITCGVEGEENMGLNVGAGQYMCINSQSSEEDQKAAEEFLVWLFSSDTGKELVSKKLQFVTPFSTMEDAVYDNPLFASQSAIAAAGKTAYCWASNLIPDQTWKDNMGGDLLQYAQGQMEWDDVVTDAVDTWAVERDITNAANAE